MSGGTVPPEPDPDPDPPEPEPSYNTIVVQANIQNTNSNPVRIRFSASASGTDWLPFTTPFTTGDQYYYQFDSSWEGVECTVKTEGTTVYPRWFRVSSGQESDAAPGYALSYSPSNPPWDPSSLASASTTANWD